jgi:hypothetical protein
MLDGVYFERYYFPMLLKHALAPQPQKRKKVDIF